MNQTGGVGAGAGGRARELMVSLDETPASRRLRERAFTFSSVVCWHPEDIPRRELVREFRRILDAGFTSARFHTCAPVQLPSGEVDFARTDEWFDAAEEAGIGVVMHPSFGKPSDGALARRGLTRDEFDALPLDDPLARAVVAEYLVPVVEHLRVRPALLLWAGFGEPHAAERDFRREYDRGAFGRWLEGRYGSLEALDRAWNIYPGKGRLIARSFADAWRVAAKDASLAGLTGADRHGVVYGAQRDRIRYFTDRAIERVRAIVAMVRERDPEHAFAVGSHQLLLNQPDLGWDSWAWARVADAHFASIHLSWHFDLVKGEVDRPVYAQARLTRDYLKGGFTSAFETTGGAVQYSGGYGNAMTPGLMRRLTASYLAAGNLAIAFWTWNHRPGGWESGEYGMTTLSGMLSSWGVEAGRAARGLARHARELWEADHEPAAGVVLSWDTDAILTCEPESHELEPRPGGYATGTRSQAWRARVGAARALMNRHVPFEFVDEREPARGFALRYPSLYAPHVRACSDEVVESLAKYAGAGGRVVADVQFGFQDQWGKVRRQGEGSAVERLFGAWIDTIQDARTAARSVNGIPLSGFFGDLVATRAKVLARFQDGSPAVSECPLGNGSAVLAAFDPARMCFEPDAAPAMEEYLASLVMGPARREWECDSPLAFRLSSQAADHWFLVNDGPARTCTVRAFDRRYVSGEEVFDGKPVDVRGTIAVDVPAESAVWLRLARG